MSATISRLIEHWRRIAVDARPGLSDAEIAELETRHGVRLPPAMRQLHRGIDGIELDDHALSVWPLRDIGRVSERVASYRGVPDYEPIAQTLPDADEYFAFADGMIWSAVLAMRLTPDGADAPVIWISGATWIELAPSFEELCEMHLRDPDAVVFGLSRTSNAAR